MSDRLRFTAEGSKRRLYRLKPNGPFHVRFQHAGRDTPRSLGTTNVAVAIEKAKKLIAAVYAQGTNSEVVRRMKVRTDFAFLRPVCNRYIAEFGLDARTRRTARGNVGALAKVVQLGAGLSLDDARVSVLTGELVRRYEKAYAAKIASVEGNLDPASELRIRTTIGSYLRQARSVFRPSRMNWFEEFMLPDLTSFRQQGVTAPKRPKPRPLDAGVIEQINAAAPRLAIEDPACYSAHLLFKYLGMRNGEIRAARRNWIVRDENGLQKLGIIYRAEEGFKPKNKTERWITVAPEILAEIEHFAEPGGEGYLVPAPNKTERANIVDKRHSAWVGQWIKDHSKTSYELRRYAGSKLYKKTGRIEHVQQFLGHADLQTTMNWYWYLLGEVPALDPSDFA